MLTAPFTSAEPMTMEEAYARVRRLIWWYARKFAREGLAAIYAESGLEMVAWWMDPEGQFALSLARRAGSG